LPAGAFVGVEQVADVLSDGLDDPQAREQLQPHADAQQSGRVGQVVFLADDVGHQILTGQVAAG
jgi:hypothetical protein